MVIVTARVRGYAKPLVAILGHLEVLVRLSARPATVLEVRKVACTTVKIGRPDYRYPVLLSEIRPLLGEGEYSRLFATGLAEAVPRRAKVTERRAVSCIIAALQDRLTFGRGCCQELRGSEMRTGAT